MYSIKDELWLIGPGNIGYDYAKVLISQKINFRVIGRSSKSEWLVPVYEFGLTNFIKENKNNIPKYAIVAVDESELFNITKELIEFGVKNILIEKPAGINIEQVEYLESFSHDNDCKLFVAYNRRFYQSVKRCKKIIDNESGPINVNFTFTEWTHLIDYESYTKKELEHFFLGNSSHVPDTVFYLCGQPSELQAYVSGALRWHPSACSFSGAGLTNQGISFSYNANWESAGRWGIEVNMPNKKLILRPLEKLQVQHLGSNDIEQVPLENEEIDLKFKPGLFEEVKSFLGEQQDLCTIKQQAQNFKWYYKIANY